MVDQIVWQFAESETSQTKETDILPKFSAWGGYALFLLCIPLLFFPLRAALQPDNLPPMRLELHIHAVSSGLWCVLVLLQSLLIGSRKHRLHKTLGWWSIGLAVSLVISGLIINYQFYLRLDIYRAYLGGIVSMVMFSLFYISGILMRRSPDFHKRMMIFATICCMPAPLNRVAFITEVSPEILSGPVWLAMAAVVPAYDIATQRKLTKASWFALAVWIAAVVFMANFAHSQSFLGGSSGS